MKKQNTANCKKIKNLLISKEEACFFQHVWNYKSCSQEIFGIKEVDSIILGCNPRKEFKEISFTKERTRIRITTKEGTFMILNIQYKATSSSNLQAKINMQGIGRALLQHTIGREGTNKMEKLYPLRSGCALSSPIMQQKGLENMTVAEVLTTKGDAEKVGSWLWCHTNDTVIDAVKHMAENNIGSLVVLKPEGQCIAGIVTERDYLRKIIAQGRSPTYTRVAEIMTDENKLITVTSNTNILKAMQLMTDNRIRHVPVIDGRIVGMISIVDVVRAVVDQQSKELERLNGYIKGEYY